MIVYNGGMEYKKGGKALCTLYPKQGCFIALIPVGTEEITEADLLILLCDEYTQNVYSQMEFGTADKSLPIEVASENILCVINTIKVGLPKRFFRKALNYGFSTVCR